MLSRDVLVEASRKGLLEDSQIGPLHDFLVGLSPNEELTDPEEMRFARGFHDIFISLGLGILFAGYFIGAAMIGGSEVAGSVLMFGGGMGLTWLLAEWFSKRLRLSLPSILLTGAFVLLSGLTTNALIDMTFGVNGADVDLSNPIGLSNNAVMFAAPFLAALMAGGIYYRRFGVPITPALLSVAGSGLVFFVIAMISGEILTNYLGLWLFLIGLGCLGLALWFDSKDPMRQTVNSDKAFWLHLVAAPLIVHSVLSIFADSERGGLAAFATILLVLVMGVFALIIDRRALLASAIGYLGFAVAVLLDKVNLGEAAIISLTLLLLGTFVLMLGSGWTSLRRLLLRPFADHPLLAKLPSVLPKGSPS